MHITLTRRIAYSKVSLVSSCPRGASGRKLLRCILDTYTDLESFSGFRAHRRLLDEPSMRIGLGIQAGDEHVCYEYHFKSTHFKFSNQRKSRFEVTNWSYLSARHVKLEALVFGTVPADSSVHFQSKFQGTHVVGHAPYRTVAPKRLRATRTQN